MRNVYIATVPLLMCCIASAQTNVPVVGFMHAIHATNNVDKTAEFYREVLGISGPPARALPNTNVPILTNSPGANLRVSMMNLPGNGFNFELTEFTNVERHPAQ